MSTLLSPSAPKIDGQSGAAMVEFSILMVVFIPLVYYAIFLCDVAYHQLEIQETVVSTTWDFSTRNEEPPPPPETGLLGQVWDSLSGQGPDQNNTADQNRTNEVAQVQFLDRLEYDDHTSSFDDGAEGTNDNNYTTLTTDSENHHNQLAAHACWIGANGSGTLDNTTVSAYDDDNTSTQVTCQINAQQDLAWAGTPTSEASVAFGMSGYNKGGLVNCWAKAWVYNFMVPENALQDHADTKLSTKKLQTGDTASIKGAGGKAANILVRDQAAISFDTWALVDGAADHQIQDADINTNVDDTNPFYSRAQFVYKQAGPLQKTYNDLMKFNLAFMGIAAPTVEIINAIPHSGAFTTNFAPDEPANISTFYLTARYQSGDTHRSSPGYEEQCPPLSPINFDMGCSMGGPKYESTPFQNFDSNSKYKSAFQKRTLHYLGCQDPYKC
jgi:hypothetical protein